MESTVLDVSLHSALTDFNMYLNLCGSDFSFTPTLLFELPDISVRNVGVSKFKHMLLLDALQTLSLPPARLAHHFPLPLLNPMNYLLLKLSGVPDTRIS